MMVEKTTLSRIERLDKLAGLLRSHDFHQATDLADQLCVSKRTVMRDLEVLRAQGYPIETSQGKGGGIQLHRLWGLGRLNLSYQEIIDLLLSLAVMERMPSSLFFKNLDSIRYKIAASFPQGQRDKIKALRKRIMVGDLASADILSQAHPVKTNTAGALYEAFFTMHHVTIHYKDAAGNKTIRTIEPHYLFLNWPVWYVLAWDLMRDDVRCFRLDRINKASLCEQPFKLKRNKVFIEEFRYCASAL